MVDSTRQALFRSLILGLMVAGLIVIATPERLAVHAQIPEGTTVSIVPSFSSVFSDESSFSIFVVVEELSHSVVIGEVLSEGLGAFEFTVLYDPAVVEVAEAAPGPALETTGRSFQCFDRRDEPGSFSFACASLGSEPAGPQGSFTLASVKLTPVSSGSTFLVLQAGLAGLLGDEVPIEVVGGAVVDVRSSIATVTPAPSTVVPPTQPAPGTATALAATATPLPPSSPGGTALPALTPTAGSNNTPASPTQTNTPAPTGGSETPDPQTPAVTAENGNDAPGDGSSTGVILWSLLAAAGGLAAAGVLGVMVVRWQRRQP